MDEEVALAASVDRKRSERRRPPLTFAAPWLVIPYGKGSQNHAFYNICEPHKKSIRKSIPELIAKIFWQKPCHQGWLIVLCDNSGYDYTPDYDYGDCFLWNPATLETIQLPSLQHWLVSSSVSIHDCVLSSPPEDGDSMVLFLFSSKHKSANHVFLHCGAGDKQWRIKKLALDIIPTWEMVSLHCFKGKLYVMCSKDQHFEIDREKLWNKDDGITQLPIKTLQVPMVIPYQLVGGWETCCMRYYFVETSEDLFYVTIRYNQRAQNKVVIQIAVMKLDFSAMQWEVVNCLGDHVLFIGSSTTACCSAAEAGLERGCLYYTHPEDQSLYKFEVESTGNSVILPCLKLPTPWFYPNWITVPNGRKREKEMVGGDGSKKSIMKGVNGKQGEEDYGGDLEKACPWDILLEEMVESIASYLHRLDCIHFRAVCKANRAIMPMEKVRSTSTSRCTHISPWLMFSRDHSRTTFNFINPMHENENYLMNHFDLVGATVRFQKGGWLLMSVTSQETLLFFYNPFTREAIKLPELPFDYSFSGISFSSLPTSLDCVVFSIEAKGGDEVAVCFIRKGEAFWNGYVFPNTDRDKYFPLLNTPVFCKGVFYCLDYNGTLGVFNIEDNSWKVLEKPRPQFSAVYPNFLVECGGELLSVKLGRHETLFGVFKLDFSKMDWVRVENLGKYMLFISYISCFSAIAPNSRMSNRIYFPRLCLNGDGVLVYSLETGNYQSSGEQHSVINSYDTEGWFSNCTYIEPNWLKSKPQELDWVQPPS